MFVLQSMFGSLFWSPAFALPRSSYSRPSVQHGVWGEGARRWALTVPQEAKSSLVAEVLMFTVAVADVPMF